MGKSIKPCLYEINRASEMLYEDGRVLMSRAVDLNR